MSQDDKKGKMTEKHIQWGKSELYQIKYFPYYHGNDGIGAKRHGIITGI